jgi:peroxiredoxin
VQYFQVLVFIDASLYNNFNAKNIFHIEINFKIYSITIHKKRLLQMRMVLTTFLLILLTARVFSQPKVNEPAPEISLPDMDGKTVSLSSFIGKVVLLDFWASWCGPCRNNNPHLVKFYKKFHPKGLEIIGISFDENDEAWKKAVEKDKLSWIQLNDNKGNYSASASSYNVDAIPASFLIDKKGVIHSINLVGRNLEAEVKQLLKE